MLWSVTRSGFEHFAGGLGAANRQLGIGEQAELFEDRSLVSIVSMNELAIAELHDGHERYFDMPIRGCKAGQHPGHLLRVGETEDHLVNHLVPFRLASVTFDSSFD